MIALFATAGLLLSGPSCAAPPGSEALWTPEARYVIIGEIHGTTETPAAFAGLVCEASTRGPVTVALELPMSLQPEFEAFLAAPDDVSGEAILRRTAYWNPRHQDGRSSAAMVEMMQSLRRLRVAGRDIAIRAFLSDQGRPAGFDQNYHELEMATEIARAARARPEARVLVLVGNVHASKTRIDMWDLLPAAAHLPRAEVIALDVAQQGGQSWSCRTDVCGIDDIISVYDPAERGVTLGPIDDGAYDGVLAVGPVTASPPAAGD